MPLSVVNGTKAFTVLVCGKNNIQAFWTVIKQYSRNALKRIIENENIKGWVRKAWKYGKVIALPVHNLYWTVKYFDKNTYFINFFQGCISWIKHKIVVS